ncbi:MAG: glycoside hydrolase family 5 protein [Porcipelethomonas sp.]
MNFKKIMNLLAAVVLGVSAMTACSGDSESGTKDISSMTASEIAADMKVGWNLGNSLDAVGTGINSETAWGNPRTTKEFIDKVKAAGFNTVRIPVTWMGHFGEAPDYKIDEDWLARVKEVAGYALDNDMYAIINIHHDGMDSGESWLTPEPADADAMVAEFETLWTQIADYFSDSSEKLLFAGMNEFHKGYDTPKDEYLELTDRLNQSFVDTVRKTGGKNKNRVLIFQSYNTNGDYAVKNLKIPADTVKNKLMAEFHFYDPWNFAGTGNGSWGINGPTNDRWGQEDWTDDLFSRIKTTFVDNDIPVILGEYGAVNNKSGYTDTRRYYIEYVTRTAKKNGIVPIWWDNGYDGNDGEAFALFDRNSGEVIHQDILDAIMRACGEDEYEIEIPVY